MSITPYEKKNSIILIQTITIHYKLAQKWNNK